MTLPFKIWDGKTKKLCTFEDLWIIHEFGLTYQVYAKRSFFRQRRVSDTYLKLVYASLKAIREANKRLPYSKATFVADASTISLIKCAELHKWKKNAFVKLLMSVEL